jgi:DNA-binding transcriptional LysR family regulator
MLAGMDFDRLRAFVWILEEGSVSAAARRLCRTQPAVTRMLQTLEDQVGAELIDRRARPMKPTAAGARVLEHRRMGLSRSLMHHLQDTHLVTPEPPLRETDFVVRSGWSPRLYRRFARGEFDCAVLLMPSQWTPDMPCRSEVVRNEPLVIVAPRDMGAAANARTSLESLCHRAWVLNPDGCGFRGSLLQSFAQVGHRPRIQFELDASPQEHLAMVAAGVGCSIVPESALHQPSSALPRVQRLDVPGFTFELSVSLLWAERAKPTAGTEEALASIFRRQEPILKQRPVSPPLRFGAV